MKITCTVSTSKTYYLELSNLEAILLSTLMRNQDLRTLAALAAQDFVEIDMPSIEDPGQNPAQVASMLQSHIEDYGLLVKLIDDLKTLGRM